MSQQARRAVAAIRLGRRVDNQVTSGLAAGKLLGSCATPPDAIEEMSHARGQSPR